MISRFVVIDHYMKLMRQWKQTNSVHYSEVTYAPWCLKSRTTRLSFHPLVQIDNKDTWINYKRIAMRRWFHVMAPPKIMHTFYFVSLCFDIDTCISRRVTPLAPVKQPPKYRYIFIRYDSIVAWKEFLPYWSFVMESTAPVKISLKKGASNVELW